MASQDSEQVCKQCGGPMPPYAGRGARRIFCTLDCTTAWHGEHRMSRGKPKPEILSCLICSQVFIPRSHVSKYCSKQCAWRAYVMVKKYRLPPEEYRRMLDEQGGVCPLCHRTPAPGAGSRTGWHVDHDHETGQVRGLLCGGCNTGLGMLGDDEAGLLTALEYVRRARHRRLRSVNDE